ncbi:MAG: outer membrane beta-barrel protein, partial [Xanthobacteraceae bacterium]
PVPGTLPLGATPRPTLPFLGGDPYEALGLRAGSFIILPAVELSAGWDNNPQHLPGGPGSSTYLVAPELHVRSDWARNAFTADIIGSYYWYGNDSFQPSLNRPYLNAKFDGRIDVTRDTQILLENRYIVSTDSPGSPNIQANLATLPINTTVGGTVGVEQQFSRWDATLKGTVDRTTYQTSHFVDGESSNNDDRAYDQYAGIFRLAYEIDPGLKPFVEVSDDTRNYDSPVDFFGEDRSSNGASAKLGGEFKLANSSLVGEMAVGYLQRDYHDPTLPNVAGLTLDGSLLWLATGLTSVKFTAVSQVYESTLQGVSASFSRDVSVEVDHALRRWLIATGTFGYGHDDYVGEAREDDRYYAIAGLVYKLNPVVQVKGQLRHDWLTSTQSGNAYQSTSVLLTLRLQR